MDRSKEWDRYSELECQYREVDAQIATARGTVAPGGREVWAQSLADLYGRLFDISCEELRLAPELGLASGVVDLIVKQREYALVCAESWKGSALSWRKELAAS